MAEAIARVRPGDIFRHVKRGSSYEVWGDAVVANCSAPLRDCEVAILDTRGSQFQLISEADFAATVDHKPRNGVVSGCVGVLVQASTRPIERGDVITIYEGSDGSLYARRTDEFLDGRFELIAVNAVWTIPDIVIDTPAGRFRDSRLRRVQLILAGSAMAFTLIAIIAFLTAGDAP